MVPSGLHFVLDTYFEPIGFELEAVCAGILGVFFRIIELHSSRMASGHFPPSALATASTYVAGSPLTAIVVSASMTTMLSALPLAMLLVALLDPALSGRALCPDNPVPDVRGQRRIQAIHGSTDDLPANSRHPRMARAIHGSCHLSTSTDFADGLAFPTKMKTFWVIKYLSIYSTNK